MQAPIAPAATASPAQTVGAAPDTPSNPLLWVLLGAVAILPFGYLAAQSLKKKKPIEDSEKKSRCFDIQQLVDKQLEKLTDLKGQLEDKTQDMAREKMREVVQGTAAGDILTRLEEAEAEYERLKKLYEQCTVEFEGRLLKGTIIENSLRDTAVLDNVTVEKTYPSGDWTLHDVLVSEKEIVELSKHLQSGPWYIHFWEPGKDDIKVVFKDTVFTIKSSDRSTWTDAVAYGKSLGIPIEQLDFRTEDSRETLS